MRPTRDGEAVVDLLDVLLEDGVVLEADVVITVADVPLIGIHLRAALAGMTTMQEHGYFEDWDVPEDERVREVRPPSFGGGNRNPQGAESNEDSVTGSPEVHSTAVAPRLDPDELQLRDEDVELSDSDADSADGDGEQEGSGDNGQSEPRDE